MSHATPRNRKVGQAPAAQSEPLHRLSMAASDASADVALLPTSVVDPIKEVLLAVGGSSLSIQFIPEDLGKTFSRGVSFGKTQKRMPGQDIQCHSNSAHCWDANRDISKIATGFALSDDGVWREHSWVALRANAKRDPDPMNPKHWRTVETTENRVAYFGYILDEEECEQFLYENW